MWLTAVPYLQGVSSPWDADAPGFETSVTYSAEQVYTILTGLGLDTDEIPNAPAGWFGEGVLDSAGYVAQMPICGQVFTGTRLRSAFSLRSAAFTVAYDAGENAFVFTTHGYGHGVGLSQYGAKAMAEDGKAQTVNKLHSCLIACVGATIGRPPTYRSNAFSGTVFCKANGHGRAMLAPTSVFRQSEFSPRGGKPLAIYGSSAVNVVNSASVSKSYTFTVRLRQFSGTAAK